MSRPSAPRPRPRSSPAGSSVRSVAPTSVGGPSRSRAGRRWQLAGGQPVGDVVGDPVREDQALEQRVRRQPVGAVHAGAGHLAAGVEALEGGPAEQVGARPRRWRSAGPGPPAAARWPGRSPARGSGRRSRGSGARGTPGPGAGRPGSTWSLPVRAIRATMARATTSRGARSASRVHVLHEPHARRRPRGTAPSPRTASEISGCWPLRALAEPQHGGVELDELEVGDHRAGAQRRRDAVAGGHGGVGGGGVDLAQAAGREHDRAGVRRADAVDLALADDVQGDPADPLVGVLEQVHDQGVLDHLDARVVLHRVQRGDERPGDLLARWRRRRRGRSGRGGGRPRGSARSRRPAPRSNSAPRRDQLAHPRRSLVTQRA